VAAYRGSRAQVSGDSVDTAGAAAYLMEQIPSRAKYILDRDHVHLARCRAAIWTWGRRDRKSIFVAIEDGRNCSALCDLSRSIAIVKIGVARNRSVDLRI
jgi:hypothetical protein